MASRTQRPADAPSAVTGFRTVWPGLGLSLLVVALAYLAVPAVRHQVDLSLSRQDTPFVELYAVPLDDGLHVGTTCRAGATPGAVTVVFAVRSHLEDRETVRFQVAVSRAPQRDAGRSTAQTSFGERVFGRINLGSGVTRTVKEDVTVPARGPFEVEVRLPATNQYLSFHCDASAAGESAS